MNFKSNQNIIRSSTRKGFLLPTAHRLLLTAFCLLFLAGCRRDMQDQPRYEVYETSDFFKNGMASRRPVQGTVPRGYLREDTFLYAGTVTGGGARGAAAGGPVAGGGGQPPGGNLQIAGNAAQAGGIVQQNQPAQRPSDTPQPTGSSAAQTASQSAEDEVDAYPFPITREDLDRGQERFNAFCSMCHGQVGNADGMVVKRGFRKPTSYHTDQLRQAKLGHFFDVITNGWGSMPSYGAQIPPEDRWRIVAYIRALQFSQQATLADVPPEERQKLEGGSSAASGGEGERR